MRRKVALAEAIPDAVAEHIADTPLAENASELAKLAKLPPGQTCVGDLRLAPIDVGFDLRETGDAVELPEVLTSIGYAADGEVWLLVGERDAMVAVIRAAGYRVKDGRARS